jgi:hypothetical protein
MDNAQLLNIFNKPTYRELIAKSEEGAISGESSRHDDLCTIASEINSLKQDLIQITNKITTCQAKVLRIVVKTQAKGI